MDIYRPKGVWGELPAIVLHSWRRLGQGKPDESRENRPGSGCPRLRSGDDFYRLSGEAPFPLPFKIAKAAVRFLRANAKELGIDPNKIMPSRLSAGGHLTALLASSHGVDELEGKGSNPAYGSRIQAAVPMGLKPTSCPSVPARCQASDLETVHGWFSG